ncbi:MAG: CcmD family protein [Ignavibacteriaceae bacterium]
MQGLYQLLDKNAIYVVMIIVLIVWIGIFLYLYNLDKRIRNIEKEINGNKNAK